MNQKEFNYLGVGGEGGTTAAQWYHSIRQINRSSDQACIWGMFQKKIISLAQDVPLPNIVESEYMRIRPETPFIIEMASYCYNTVSLYHCVTMEM